jgi:hypothetical protein
MEPATRSCTKCGKFCCEKHIWVLHIGATCHDCMIPKPLERSQIFAVIVIYVIGGIFVAFCLIMAILAARGKL